MKTYIFTDRMKRYERSNLCIKLYNELEENGQIDRHLKSLYKVIDEKKQAQKKNLFKPSKEPVFAIKSYDYKGTSFYLIVDSSKDFDIIFNTSPIDAAYVEFIKVITEVSAIVYTQHVLDRYNERIQADKYENHRDILKRFIVNNPVKTDIVYQPNLKTVQRVNEGFLCGNLVKEHNCIIMNTFYDDDEYHDTIAKSEARAEFDRYVEANPEHLKSPKKTDVALTDTQIGIRKKINELIAHNDENAITDWISKQPLLDQPDIIRELKQMGQEAARKLGRDAQINPREFKEFDALIEKYEESILNEKLSEANYMMSLENLEKHNKIMDGFRQQVVEFIITNAPNTEPMKELAKQLIDIEKENGTYDPNNWQEIL